MGLKEEYRGAKKIIYSVVLNNGESPAVEFLRALKLRDLNSHKSMVIRYKRHGDNGPSGIKKHERHIRGNLWEFKTYQGDRLMYFNHPNGGTVMTNGFHKGDPPEQQFDKAESLRNAILELEANDDNA